MERISFNIILQYKISASYGKKGKDSEKNMAREIFAQG